MPEVKVTRDLSSGRGARLTGGLLAFLVTPPVAAFFVALVTTLEEEAPIGFFFTIFIFGTIDGFVLAGPVAFFLGVLVGSWCASPSRAALSRWSVLSASATFMAAGGTLWGFMLALFDAAAPVELRWGLIPVGGVVGAMVGTAVACVLTKRGQPVQGVQQAS